MHKVFRLAAGFDDVRTMGLTLPGVEAATKYDGSPVLTAGGCFMAGLATHESADAETLVVRMDPATRDLLIGDAPGTYYLTDYYERHPVVLARLEQLDRVVLRGLLLMARRETMAKVSRSGGRAASKRRRA